MIKGIKSTPLRYALAIAFFAITLGIAALLAYFSIRINLTFLIVAGLVVTSWFGGRGPGLLYAVLLVTATILMTPLQAGVSVGQAVFSYFSTFMLLVFLVLLISGRKKTEHRLRQQTDLLEVTLASIGDAVIATDVDGAVTFLNPTAETLTGWSNKEAAGIAIEKVFRIVHETTREPIENPFAGSSARV